MLTTDKQDPRLNKAKPNGQDEAYLVLPQEEIDKGYIRPYRDSYIHVGPSLKGLMKENIEVDTEEIRKYNKDFRTNYYALAKYEEEFRPLASRYITKKAYEALMKGKEHGGGCDGLTKINSEAICETYARNPKFYGATFCVHCGKHLPVEEFVWDGTNITVGS